MNKELIGNLIILLAEKCEPLYHTKLLKLLYLIDQEAVKDSGVPITWLDYKVWQYGPVDPTTYFLSDYYEEFVALCKDENGTLIKPKTRFNDLEFSEYDLEIVDKVLERYKNKTSKELVELTHQPGSLWSKTKDENDLDFEIANISEVSMDLSRLVENDKTKLAKYKEALDYAYFRSSSDK